MRDILDPPDRVILDPVPAREPPPPPPGMDPQRRGGGFPPLNPGYVPGADGSKTWHEDPDNRSDIEVVDDRQPWLAKAGPYGSPGKGKGGRSPQPVGGNRESPYDLTPITTDNFDAGLNLISRGAPRDDGVVRGDGNYGAKGPHTGTDRLATTPYRHRPDLPAATTDLAGTRLDPLNQYKLHRRPMISQPGNPALAHSSFDPALSWLATSRDDGVVRGDGNYGTKGEENMPPLAHSSLGGGISREPMPTPLQQPQGPEVGIAGLGRPDHGYQAQQQPAPAHVYRPGGIMNGYRGSPGKANGGIVSAYRQR